MSLTVQAVAYDLLRYMRKEQRTLPTPASEDDPLPGILNAINSTLIEISALGPKHLFRDRRSAIIYAPATITVPTITTDEDHFVFTTGNGWLPYMLGCSIRFGTEVWNEIVGYNDTTHTVSLLNPVAAGGTNLAATIYCDSISPAADVLQVMPPVAIADGYALGPVHSLGELQGILYDSWPNEDYSRNRSYHTTARRVTYRPSPLAYFVDTRFDAVNEADLRIRLAPMPTTRSILNYRAKLAPATYVTDDIWDGNDYTIDPMTAIPLSDHMARAVFLPIARKNFMSSPMFRNDNVVPHISIKADEAYKLLERMKPQSRAGFRIGAHF